MSWAKPSRTTVITAVKPIAGAMNGTKPTKHAKSAAITATRTAIAIKTAITVTGMAIIATSVAITCIFATTATVIATTAIMIVTAVVIGIGTPTVTNFVVGFGY